MTENKYICKNVYSILKNKSFMAVRMSSINIIIINRLKNRCDYVLCLTFNV